MRPDPGVALALSLALGGGAAAETLRFGDWLELGGYTRAFSAVHRERIEGSDEALEALDRPELAAFSAWVARAEWGLGRRGSWRLDLHQRLAWRATTPESAAAAVGTGVTPAPRRTIDLRSELIERPGFALEHDIDRAVLRLFTAWGDLACGRQGIKWGTSRLFDVSDLWAGFSPYDLDTSQKRGLDALRLIASPSARSELDLVVADRGSWHDLSAGCRLSWFLERGDLYLAGGRFWDRPQLLAGATETWEQVNLRAESAWWGGASGSALRATAGLDWYPSAELLLALEAHHNGDGAAAARYYAQLMVASDPLLRGETYLLGRDYAGALIAWQPHPLLTLSALSMANLSDSSALLSWSIAAEPLQGTTLSAGAFHGLGAALHLDPEPAIGSEYGCYGQLFYFEMAAYF